MNVRMATQVVLVCIILTLLVVTPSVYKYCQHMPFVLNSRIERDRSTTSPNISSWFVSKMTSSGLHCGKVSNVIPDEAKLLKRYWQLVNDYKLFHRDGVKRINDGNSSSVRTLTWHCSSYLCGGLGYRLIGMAVNLLFAIHSNRVFLLKWDRISAEQSYLLPNMVDWRYPNHTLNGSSKDLGSFHLNGRLEHFEKEMFAAFAGNISHVQLLYNSERAVDWFVSKLGLKFNKSGESLGLSHLNNVRLYYSVSFPFLFKFNEQLHLFASEVRKRLHIHGQKYVAMHVRTGNFYDNLTSPTSLTEPMHSRFLDSNSKWLSATECAIKQADKYIGPHGKVVVVSDSASVKRQLAKINPRLVFLDNVIVHIDKLKELDESGMLGTWQDIIIMAEARIVVCGNSAFPRLSLAICGIPKRRVVNYKSC